MKKTYGIIILSVLILSIFLSVNVNAETAPVAASLDVSFVNQLPDPVEPGDIVDVRFKIENLGREQAADVKIEFVESELFSIVDGDAIRDVGSLGGQQKDNDAKIIKYRIKVANDAPSGDNEITLKITNDDWNTVQIEDSFTITVNTLDPVIELVSVSTLPEKVAPGQEIQLNLKVKSLTSSEMRDVKVAIDLEDTTTKTYYFAPLGSANEQVIDSIMPNEEKEFIFNLIASTNAPIQIEKIPVTVSYLDNDGVSYSKSYIIGLKVYEEPEYSVALEDKTIYKENQKGTVVFSIANRGNANLNYLEVEIVEQPELYKILGKTNVYIGNLESDDFDTAEFEIFTKNSKYNVLPVKINVKYKDDYGKIFEQVHSVDIALLNQMESYKYGLEQPQGVGAVFNIMLLVIILAFMAFMLLDLKNNKLPKTKKIIWLILILTGIGALIYFFKARSKKKN